jgi:hypothetical protein
MVRLGRAIVQRGQRRRNAEPPPQVQSHRVGSPRQVDAARVLASRTVLGALPLLSRMQHPGEIAPLRPKWRASSLCQGKEHPDRR